MGRSSRYQSGTPPLSRHWASAPSSQPSSAADPATTAYLTRLRTPAAGTVCPSDARPSIPSSGGRCPVLRSVASAPIGLEIAWYLERRSGSTGFALQTGAHVTSTSRRSSRPRCAVALSPLFLAFLSASPCKLSGGSAAAESATSSSPGLRAEDGGDVLTPVVQSVKSPPSLVSGRRRSAASPVRTPPDQRGAGSGRRRLARRAQRSRRFDLIAVGEPTRRGDGVGDGPTTRLEAHSTG